jgi:hypothetical protein
MRLLIAASASAFALACLAPAPADAQGRGARAANAESQSRFKRNRGVRVAQRAPAVGHNGLCQRDNGIPFDKLNLRNRCEAEEFWTRMNERNSDVGR